MNRMMRIALGLVLSLGVGFLFLERGSAQEKGKVVVSAQQSIVDVLNVAKENKLHVYVNLKGGTQYSARVKDVSNNAVILKNPKGKEFYEVYAVIKSIVSVEVRVRSR